MHRNSFDRNSFAREPERLAHNCDRHHAGTSPLFTAPSGQAEGGARAYAECLVRVLRSVRPCHFGGNSTQSSSRTGNTHLRRKRAEHCEMGRFYGITETWNNPIYGQSGYPYPQVGLYAYHTRLQTHQCGAGRKHDTRMKPRGDPTRSSRFVSFESEKRVRQGSPDPPRMREAALIFIRRWAHKPHPCFRATIHRAAVRDTASLGASM